MMKVPTVSPDEITDAEEAERLLWVRGQEPDATTADEPAGRRGRRRDVQSVFRCHAATDSSPLARGGDVRGGSGDGRGGDAAAGIAASGLPAGSRPRDVPPRRAMELLRAGSPDDDLPQKAARMPAALFRGSAGTPGRRPTGCETREGGALLPTSGTAPTSNRGQLFAVKRARSSAGRRRLCVVTRTCPLLDSRYCISHVLRTLRAASRRMVP
jgi:hypothetical protein